MTARRARTLAVAAALVLLPPASALGADDYDPDAPTTGQAAPAASGGNPLKAVKGLFGGGDDGVSDKTAYERYRSDGFDYGTLVKDRPTSRRIIRNSGHGIVDHAKLQAYLNGIAAKLVAAGPEPNLPVVVHPVAVTDFSAIAYADGSVLVGMGLLLDLQYEDELAFVMAHELSHVIYRHRGIDSLVEAQRKLLTVGRFGLSLVDSFEQVTGKEVDKDDDAKKAMLIGTAIHQASDVVVGPAWTREEEDIADEMGIDMMLRAGYSDEAVDSYFKAHRTWDIRRRGQKQALNEAEMERRMNEAVRKKGLFGVVQVFSSSLVDSFGQLKDELSKKHKDVEVRRERAGEYLDEHYEEVDAVDRIPLPWTEAGGDKAMARLFANYKEAIRVSQVMNDGDLAKAEGLARKGVGKPTSYHGFTRHAFYRVRTAQGEDALALKNLELALRGKEPSLVIYKSLIREAEADGNLDQAFAYLEQARERLDDPAGLLPTRIRLYKRAGRNAEIINLKLTCDLEYPEFAKDCAEALKEVE